MTVVEPRTWIARSGQRSKAIVTLTLACFAPAAAVLAFAFGEAAVGVVLLAIAVGSFVAFAALIRCPKCRTRVAWMVVTTRPSSRWLTDLFALEECPMCDDRGLR
jgi:hypothetical protein